MDWLRDHSGACQNECIGLGLEYGSAALLHLVGAVSQTLEELPRHLLHFGLASQTGVCRHLLPRPVPDRLVGIEVRAVTWQGNQTQLHPWGGQKLADWLTPMGRAVVPDHDERLRMVAPQLAQEGRRGLCRAVAFRLHLVHFPRLQTDSRIVGGLFTQAGTGRIYQRWLPSQYPLASQVGVGSEVGLIHEEDLGADLLRLGQQRHIEGDESRSFLCVGLQQPLLRTLQHEAQPMQVVQTTTVTQFPAKTLPDKLLHHFPVPVRHFDPRLLGRSLHCRFHLGLLPLVEGGGGPPVCSKAIPAGPTRLKSPSQSPMVCASRSNASATCAADQPRANSQRTCQRSRSRGVGARYIRSRTARASNCHCLSRPLTSSIAEPRYVISLRTAYRMMTSAGFILGLV